MKRFFLTALFSCTLMLGLAQDMLPVWARSFGGPGWDIANTLTISPTGDAWVTGTFTDSIDIEGQWFYSKGYTDIVVAKYGSEGKPKGAFTIGGKGNERALFSVYDGYLVLLAQYQNPVTIGGETIDSTGRANYFIGWFDEKGSLVEKNTISSTGTLSFSSMNCDGKGAVYLTGWYSDTLRYNGEVYSVSEGESPLALVLQEKGKARPQEQAGGLEGKRLNACAVQEGNKMLVAGTTTGDGDKDASNPDIVYHTLFTSTINQGGKVADMQDLIKGIGLKPVSIVQSKGDTWIAAKFKYYCLNGKDTLKAKGLSDILLVKIPEKKRDMQLWTIGGYGDDSPLYLKTSGDQVILAGSFSDTIWFGENDYLVANEMGSDMFVAEFGEGESPVKRFSLGGLYNDFPRAMATSDAGVYLLGQFREKLTAGQAVLESRGSYDIVVARFENCSAKQPIEIVAETFGESKGKGSFKLTAGGGYTDYQWSDGLGGDSIASTYKAKEYTVEATDVFGCRCNGVIDLSSLKSALSANDGTKVSNAQQAGFKLYPTVTTGVVYWLPGSKFPATGATLRVTDVKGSVMVSREYYGALYPLAVQTVDMGRLIPGQYLVSITGKGYKECEKVVVK